MEQEPHPDSEGSKSATSESSPPVSPTGAATSGSTDKRQSIASTAGTKIHVPPSPPSSSQREDQSRGRAFHTLETRHSLLVTGATNDRYDDSTLENFQMLVVGQLATVQQAVASGLNDTLRLITEHLPDVVEAACRGRGAGGAGFAAKRGSTVSDAGSNTERLWDLQAENRRLKQKLASMAPAPIPRPSDRPSQSDELLHVKQHLSIEERMELADRRSARGSADSLCSLPPGVPIIQTNSVASHGTGSTSLLPGVVEPDPIADLRRNKFGSQLSPVASANSSPRSSSVSTMPVPPTAVAVACQKIPSNRSVLSNNPTAPAPPKAFSGGVRFAELMPGRDSRGSGGSYYEGGDSDGWDFNDSECEGDDAYNDFKVLSVWAGDRSNSSQFSKGSHHEDKQRNFKSAVESGVLQDFAQAHRPISIQTKGSGDKEQKKVLNSMKTLNMARKQTARELARWESCCGKVVIHPNAICKAAWDCVSCLLVFYDMFWIPFELMLPEETFFSYFMAWLARAFWTVDIPVSFLSGFYMSNGDVQMRPKFIALRYIKSWFFFDQSLVAQDWLEFFISSDVGGLGILRFGKASRALRVMRMARLLRLIRIREILMVIAERVRSEKLILLADIFKISMATLLFAHLVACVWYGIGTMDASETWVLYYSLTPEEATLASRYGVSMHWSLCQFTGGMDEFVPRNTPERGYVIIVFVVTFLLAGVFVSRLTSSMTRLQMLSNNQAQQIVTLRRYLGQHGISHKLTIRVQRSAQYAVMESQRYIPEEKAELLTLVSEPLRAEVHFEIYSQVFTVHPFFRKYLDNCKPVMRRVCHMACSHVQVSQGDVIFSTGEIPKFPKMYFVCAGELLYTLETMKEFHSTEASSVMTSYNKQESSMSQLADASIRVLAAGKWISEPTLWTQWTHRGVLTAVTNSRLGVLDALTFQNIYCEFEHPAYFDPKAYAASFVKSLNTSPSSEVHDAFNPEEIFGHFKKLDRSAVRAESPEEGMRKRMTVKMTELAEQVQQVVTNLRTSR